MLNNNRNKFILCLVIGVLLISLVVIFNNRDTKLDNNTTNEGNGEIIDNGTNEEVIDRDEDVVVNSVVDATANLVLRDDMTVQVVDGNVKVGNKTLELSLEEVEVVTGYYYQPGATYCLFAKTTNKNIYVLNFDSEDELENKNFKKVNVTNVDKLSLYDVTVTNDLIDQVDERNRVYAINGDNKIQLDTYCFTYDSLD